MDDFLENERHNGSGEPLDPSASSGDLELLTPNPRNNPMPLFTERFTKMRNRVTPTEAAELKAMSLGNLCDEAGFEHLEGEVRSNFSDANGSQITAENLTFIERRETFVPRDADVQDCPSNPFGSDNRNSSLYFLDGERSVDFVLAWRDEEAPDSVKEERAEKRFLFEQNLVTEGLELEHEVVEGEFHFVKIHATVEVLRRYAEILKFRMPMKEIPGVAKGSSTVIESITKTWKRFHDYIVADEENFPTRSHRFTAIYSRDKEYLFDLSQKNFFTSAVRSRVVQFILDRKRFASDPKSDFAFGIERLVEEEVYMAAYPLHDGEINVPGSMRHRLYTKWASVRYWYRYQPLDYIKDYFGVKIGLYFAWLGYYTYMLMLAAIVGLGCFIYSWSTSSSYRVAKEVCNSDEIVCPPCDTWCDYWKLKEACLHTKISYLIDNPTTVFFAIFMSFWAALFLELWKRYSAEITHRWDLTGFDVHEEHPRPQYLARLANVRKKKIDVVTNTEEPQVPFWRMKLPATLFSASVVVLLITLAFAAVFGVVLYRMSVLTVLAYSDDYDITTSWALLFTSTTAAIINLTLIVIFNWLYTYLAEYLTEFELLRTQTEFDDSLTLKIYLLQFVNYYSSIFYIAFFKGKFIGFPGNYNRFFTYRQEECGLGGCLMELCIQLAIIMIGKQTMNAIIEMATPIFWKWYNSLKTRIGTDKKTSLKGKGQRWLRDLKLLEWGPRSLFPEYLEMVLQYGFVTIFVAAFPLAPLFALLNNILEMRLDAKKLLTYHRRPVIQRVRDIGIWYRILDCIGKLSVITNGFIIAFTSDFIPKLIYRLYVSEENNLNGYLDFSLSTFHVADFSNYTNVKPRITEFPNITTCRYTDFRESQRPYSRTAMYWIVLASRLAFVVLFENIVAVVMILVRWCIPDMPQELRDQIRREAYITNEIIIKQETKRAREEKLTGLRQRRPVSRTESMLKWEKFASSEMTGSQLDLEMHYENQRREQEARESSRQTFV